MVQLVQLNCTIQTSQPEECIIPENNLSPRSDPYFYIKLHLQLLTHLRSELVSACYYEHATFDPSTIHEFIRSQYTEIHYHPDTWCYLIGQVTDGMDRISREPCNTGAVILPMEVWLSLDEFKEEVDYGLPEEPLTSVIIEESDTTESICAICHEKLCPNFIASRTLCNHLFHILCIDEWLKRSETCPLCRSNLPKPDYSFELPDFYSDSDSDDDDDLD